MNVKGTGLLSTRNFVKTNYPDRFDQWLQALPSGTRKYYEDTVDASQWYPLYEAYIVPTNVVIELFFKGDYRKGGEEIGRYSAEYALKGIYRVFMLVSTPKFMMTHATRIMTTFYMPSTIQIAAHNKKEISLKITEFAVIDATLEYRVAGWCQRALELTGCNNVHYEIPRALSRKDRLTEINFRWD